LIDERKKERKKDKFVNFIEIFLFSFR